MRKRRAEKRKLQPDTKYNDIVVSRLINNIMKEGKKNVSRTIIYDAFEEIEKRAKSAPLDIFRKALTNVAPVIEVRSRRVGGATYQVPVEVREDRRIALALRWIITYAKARRDKSMALRLAAELMAASKGEGSSVKKRDDTHRMAEANKAFAHYRW